MRKEVRSLGLGLTASVGAIVLALLLASIILLIDGSNPLTAYLDMFEYGARWDIFVNMLNRATPFYLSAIAVAIGFRMNLFNIGVEGQYILAGIIVAKVGTDVTFLPAPLHVLLLVLVAMAVGGAWAVVPAVLKVTRGIHEVISTIMFNAIAISFVVAFLLRRWQVVSDGPDLNTQTEKIPSSGRMPSLNRLTEWLTGDTPALNGFLVVAIIVGLLYWVYTVYTRPGFDLRASGMNPLAAQAAGVSPGRTIIMTMILSGAIAGLIGLPQILGNDYNYNLEFIKMLGFNGIAVALLGQNHPGGIAISAIFFSYLDTTAPILDVTGAASSEIVTIMKGIIIFVMVIAYEYTRRLRESDEAKRSAILLTQKSAENGSESHGRRPE